MNPHEIAPASTSTYSPHSIPPRFTIYELRRGVIVSDGVANLAQTRHTRPAKMVMLGPLPPIAARLGRPEKFNAEAFAKHLTLMGRVRRQAMRLIAVPYLFAVLAYSQVSVTTYRNGLCGGPQS